MYDNEYEIRVFGIKHSGQHAIINWIATLFDEPVYFFNNCGWNHDPYRTRRTRGVRKGTAIEDIFVPLPKLKDHSEEDLNKIKRTPKKCLMYSYENVYVDRINREKGPATPEGIIGKSWKTFDVLMLRDIFNLVASTMKYTGRVFNERDRAGDDEYLSQFDYKNYLYRDKLKKKYELAAIEFLGWSNHLREKRICISFNDWFLSKGYRACIASQFGLHNNEISVSVVAGVGNRGSRFDDFEYDGRAQEMNILERWKYFKDNKAFWDLMREWKYSVWLSNEIFGEIPGTMEYVNA
jgi:hypothetical protein